MFIRGLYKSLTTLLFVHFRLFYAFLALVYTLPFFASSPPSDDREMTERQPRDKKRTKSPSLLHMSKKLNILCNVEGTDTA